MLKPTPPHYLIPQDTPWTVARRLAARAWPVLAGLAVLIGGLALTTWANLS